MKRLAFVMKLLPGFEGEYERRHLALWPGLVTLLKQSGVSEYSIFLDPLTLNLFAFLHVDDEALWNDLPLQEIMQQWWYYMKDIMETHTDHSPAARPLKEVFYLP